ncbi:unnamed protein product [Urochloa humidicola]
MEAAGDGAAAARVGAAGNSVPSRPQQGTKRDRGEGVRGTEAELAAAAAWGASSASHCRSRCLPGAGSWIYRMRASGGKEPRIRDPTPYRLDPPLARAMTWRCLDWLHAVPPYSLGTSPPPVRGHVMAELADSRTLTAMPYTLLCRADLLGVPILLAQCLHLHMRVPRAQDPPSQSHIHGQDTRASVRLSTVASQARG